jgi:hypothetical protein
MRRRKTLADEVNARQRNTGWPDTLRNGALFDGLLLGVRYMRRPSRESGWRFGEFFS